MDYDESDVNSLKEEDLDSLLDKVSTKLGWSTSKDFDQTLKSLSDSIKVDRKKKNVQSSLRKKDRNGSKSTKKKTKNPKCSASYEDKPLCRSLFQSVSTSDLVSEETNKENKTKNGQSEKENSVKCKKNGGASCNRLPFTNVPQNLKKKGLADDKCEDVEPDVESVCNGLSGLTVDEEDSDSLPPVGWIEPVELKSTVENVEENDKNKVDLGTEKQKVPNELQNHKVENLNCNRIVPNSNYDTNESDDDSSSNNSNHLPTKSVIRSPKNQVKSPQDTFSPSSSFTETSEPVRWLLTPPDTKRSSSPKVAFVEDEGESPGTPCLKESLSDRLKKRKKLSRKKDFASSSEGKEHLVDGGGDRLKHQKEKGVGQCTSSEDSDDNFEKFLSAIKTPSKSTVLQAEDDDNDDFIDDTPLPVASDHEDEELFYLRIENDQNEVFLPPEEASNIPTPDLSTEKMTPSDDERWKAPSVPDSVLSISSKKSYREVFLISSSESDDDDVFITRKPTTKKKTSRTDSVFTTPSTKPKKPSYTTTPSTQLKTPKNLVGKKKETFLSSLSTPPIGTPPSSSYVKDFKKRKEELTKTLFKLFNETVFESKLPADMEVKWNKRMRKTAGYCVYSRSSASRKVRIELSEKVCDSAERLRDTLVHEMCHAACWHINGVNDGHGQVWKYWAYKANVAHPEIPVIKRCHSYEINTKYKYECQRCKAVVGRHSKSIDTSKKCCGYCTGRLVLLPSTSSTSSAPRTPNKFAMYVKENYAVVKKSNSSFKHADVMRVLSQEFAQKAAIVAKYANKELDD